MQHNSRLVGRVIRVGRGWVDVDLGRTVRRMTTVWAARSSFTGMAQSWRRPRSAHPQAGCDKSFAETTLPERELVSSIR